MWLALLFRVRLRLYIGIMVRVWVRVRVRGRVSELDLESWLNIRLSYSFCTIFG